MNPFSSLTWIKFAAAAVLLAVVAGYVGYQKLEIAHLGVTISTLETKAAKLETARAFEAEQAGERYRALEASYNNRIEDAQHEYQASLQATSAVAAHIAADRDRVRQQLAAFAAGGGDTSPAAVAALQRRADALGDVLATVLQDLGERTADAEREAAGTRDLLDSWPR